MMYVLNSPQFSVSFWYFVSIYGQNSVKITDKSVYLEALLFCQLAYSLPAEYFVCNLIAVSSCPTVRCRSAWQRASHVAVPDFNQSTRTWRKQLSWSCDVRLSSSSVGTFSCQGSTTCHGCHRAHLELLINHLIPVPSVGRFMQKNRQYILSISL